MKKALYTLLIIIIQCFASCNNSTYVETVLRNAEAIIEEHPDSALQVLRTLNINAISDKNLIAEYAFLYTDAEYKNRQKVEDVSLINISVNQFEKEGDLHKLAESLLLQGIALINTGKYDDAMSSMQYAVELGEKLNDNFLLGRVYRNLFYACKYGYNADEVGFAEKSLMYFEKTGNEDYINEAKYNLGFAYYKLDKYEKCTPLFNVVYKKAIQDSDTMTILRVGPKLAQINALNQNYNISDSLYNILPNAYGYCLRPEDYCALAASRISHKDKAEAIKLLNIADNMNDKTMSYYTYGSWVYSLIGDFEKAWSLASSYIYEKNNFNREQYSSTVLVAQRDFVAQKLESQKSLELRNNIIWCFSFTCLLLILLFGFYYFNRRIQMRKLEMENLLLNIESLKRLITDKNSAIEGLSKQLISASQDTAIINDKVMSLFEQKYKQMNDLCISYFNGQNTLFLKNSIYKQVQNIIESFSKDEKTLSELEFILNNSYDGILYKLKEEIPSLKPEDYRFFCYIFAGFSSRSISLLMKKNVDTVYQQRSRWRKRIETMNITNKEHFLKFF